MANTSKQIITQSLVPNNHPLTFTQLSTSEGTLSNANEGIRHCSFTFAVPSTYTHFRPTNVFVCHLFTCYITRLYLMSYLTLPYLTIPYILAYPTLGLNLFNVLPYLTSYVTLHLALSYLTSYLTIPNILPYHT